MTDETSPCHASPCHADQAPCGAAAPLLSRGIL